MAQRNFQNTPAAAHNRVVINIIEKESTHLLMNLGSNLPGRKQSTDHQLGIYYHVGVAFKYTYTGNGHDNDHTYGL